eukprot:scaffold2220_cov75-Cylindrotheca_fusiformis.AAC.5
MIASTHHAELLEPRLRLATGVVAKSLRHVRDTQDGSIRVRWKLDGMVLLDDFGKRAPAILHMGSSNDDGRGATND